MIAGDATITLRCSGIFRSGELWSSFGLVQVWHAPEDNTEYVQGERQKRAKAMSTALLGEILLRVKVKLFQLGADRILACRHVPAHLQDVWFAAYLAILNILLSHAGGRVYAGFVPLATSCALKSR